MIKSDELVSAIIEELESLGYKTIYEPAKPLSAESDNKED